MTITMNRNKGFSLIELMIVIAIIGILVAVALPQFASMTEDAKKTKAKQDCDTIAQSIQKYNSLEGAQVEQLMDLKGKYLTNIDTLRDPWGNQYQIDTYGGFVYSKGADGQDDKTDPKAKKNADNIRVSYIGALCLVKASLEVNPKGESIPSDAFDVLHLFFNKRCGIPDGTFPPLAPVATVFPIDLGSTIDVAPTDVAAQGKGPDDVSKCFRFCEGTKSKYVGAIDVFKQFNIDGAGTPTASLPCAQAAVPLYNGIAEAGMVYYTDDSREIVIALPAGTSGSIIPGTHFINLTGNRKNEPNRNMWFKEMDGATGAEMSGTPIVIEVND